jgi:lysozyme family protein
MGALDKALAFTLGYEGGWVNSASDAGGETFRGISRVFHGEWEGWLVIDAKRMSPSFPMNVNSDGPLAEMVTNFYEKEFWEAVHGDELPDALAMAVFDCAVHSGPGTAIRMLQSSLNILADGVIGQETIKAAHAGGEGLLVEYLTARAVFLDELMFSKPLQRVWNRNWCKRLFKLAAVVLAMP